MRGTCFHPVPAGGLQHTGYSLVLLDCAEAPGVWHSVLTQLTAAHGDRSTVGSPWIFLIFLSDCNADILRHDVLQLVKPNHVSLTRNSPV